MARKTFDNTGAHTAGSVPGMAARPKIGKTNQSLYSALGEYAKKHGWGVGQLDRANAPKHVKELEPRSARQYARAKELTVKRLKDRTTESSRKRLLDRILSQYGAVTK